MRYFLWVPIYDDIGISTGAYANFSLAAALLRIGEIAPSAEILSVGQHSLLLAANVRVIELAGLPFTVHGPFLTSSTAAAPSGTTGRRSRCTAATSPWPQSWARASTSSIPTCSAGTRVGRARGQDARGSFEELAVLQEESGSSSPSRTCRSCGHTHFRAPGDLDLHGLGLSLDVGHAAVTGTLAAWLADGTYDLKHVHLHDNEGLVGGDQHLALGRGVIDAAPVMELARAAGATVVLEHKNEADVIESLRHLHARGLIERAVR